MSRRKWSGWHRAPREGYAVYGISRERYLELRSLCQSRKYDSIVRQAAYQASEDIAEYILLSVTQNKSYDSFRVKWELKEMEQIPYCRTDFYGYRRFFYHLFDLYLRGCGA